MPFLSFELTMPQRGSTDGKWGGDNRRHIIINNLTFFTVWKILKGDSTKDFLYNFGDGWLAQVKVTKLDSTKKIPRSTNFCGYAWMIDSIITNGYIKATDGDKEMV